jgi:AraC family transcriptional regulator
MPGQRHALLQGPRPSPQSRDFAMLQEECIRTLKTEAGGQRSQRRSIAATPHRRIGHHPTTASGAGMFVAAAFIAERSLPPPTHACGDQARHSDQQHWPPAETELPCEMDIASRATLALSSAVIPASPLAASQMPAHAPTRTLGLAAWQIRKAQALLAQALDECCPVAKAAAACRLSKGHFARMFRESVGLPPHRWLTAQRIEAAKALLRNTNFPLSEIALDCGFCEQAHMCRVFRKWLGTTPAAWRRTVLSE